MTSDASPVAALAPRHATPLSRSLLSLLYEWRVTGISLFLGGTRGEGDGGRVTPPTPFGAHRWWAWRHSLRTFPPPLHSLHSLRGPSAALGE